MKFFTQITSVENKNFSYVADVFQDTTEAIDGFPCYWFFGDMDEDKDGSPDWEIDGSGAADTSVHYNGKAINGNIIPFIVLPPKLIKAVGPKVLGCYAEGVRNGVIVPGAVGDVGPNSKLGEGSSAMIHGLGGPTTRNGNGGFDTREVFYRWWPGVPASFKIGETYYNFELQSYGA